MADKNITDEEPLERVEAAIVALKMSRTYLFKLPNDTPGKYRFGRAVRFNIRELKEWARGQRNE